MDTILETSRRGELREVIMPLGGIAYMIWDNRLHEVRGIWKTRSVAEGKFRQLNRVYK
jgi:hypothetical protein